MQALESSATEVKGEEVLLELAAEPGISHVGCKSYGFMRVCTKILEGSGEPVRISNVLILHLPELLSKRGQNCEGEAEVSFKSLGCWTCWDVC